MTTPHLWEYDHPYYCGNPAVDYRERHDTWADFTEELWFSGDRDLNLLFRWDWQRWRDDPDSTPEPGDDGRDDLQLFFMQQRKGRYHKVTVKVTDEDEPNVRKFLADCAAKMREVWEPLLDCPPEKPKSHMQIHIDERPREQPPIIRLYPGPYPGMWHRA